MKLFFQIRYGLFLFIIIFYISVPIRKITLYIKKRNHLIDPSHSYPHVLTFTLVNCCNSFYLHTFMRLFSLLRKKSTAFILFLTSFVMDAWDWIRGSKLYDIRILTLSFMWNMGEQIYKKIYIFPAPWNKTIKHVWKTCIIDIDVSLFIHCCWEHYLFCTNTFKNRIFRRIALVFTKNVLPLFTTKWFLL